MTNTKLKILDLYSGIGGFSYGLESTGYFETTAFCEIDKHCQKVLKKHWPKVEIFSDVSELKWNPNYTKIDVICGGFPCQDISVAGKQRGFLDEDGKRTRSGLWFQYKRLIEEVRPNWVIIENVRNLLGNGFATVLKNLDEIGYDAEWEVISARDVGSVHLRERVWIVAYPRCRKWGASDRRDKKKLRGRETDEKEIGASHSSKTERSSNGRQVDSKKLEELADSDNFRFWPAFTSEKEKQQWWAEATSSFRNWWETESSVCRVDDGLPRELDKGRAQRIKQLGNSIVPQIATLIAQRIAYHEGFYGKESDS